MGNSQCSCFGLEASVQRVPIPPPGGGVTPGESEVRELQYKDFQKACGKFHKNNLIGEGSSGPVYRGTLPSKDGSTSRAIAAKSLMSTSESEDDFMQQVQLLSRLRHPNIVEFIAYCPEAGHRVLAYELAPLGSMSDLLHGKKDGTPAAGLTWEQRLSILQGAAEGLEVMHRDTLPGTPLVHKRIKSSNVLVFCSHVGKIADCTLKSWVDGSVIVGGSLEGLQNTSWEAPEIFTGEVSQLSDVYSFGYLMLEALCGKKTTVLLQGGRQQALKEWVYDYLNNHPNDLRGIVDPSINRDSLSDRSLDKFYKCVRKCLDASPPQRPNMKTVVKIISHIRQN